MAEGISNLFLSRDTRVYLEQNPSAPNAERTVWELSVLNGYSFSQSTNSSQVTVSEMTDLVGRARRGQRAFNDSLSPAEWSFSTYARPTIVTSKHRAPEECLWASLFSESDLITGSSALGVNYNTFDTGITTASITPSAVLVSGSTYEVTITLPATPFHNGDTWFKTGDYIKVSGASATISPNGTFVVSSATGTTLKYYVPFNPGTFSASAITVKSATLATDGNQLDITPTSSNKTSLNTFNLYFVLGGRQWVSSYAGTEHKYDASEGTTIYKISNAVVNEVTSTFDIEGITTLEWSGQGSTIAELASLDFTGGTGVTTTQTTLNLGTGGVFTLTGNTTSIGVGNKVTISGTASGGAITGYTAPGPQDYYVIAASGDSTGTTSITLSASRGGSAVTISTTGNTTGLTLVSYPQPVLLTDGLTSTTNMIRNRLTQATVNNNLIDGSYSVTANALPTIVRDTADPSNYKVTIAFAAAHQFVIGQQIRVSSFTGTNAILNGIQTITAIPTASSIEYKVSQAATITGTSDRPVVKTPKAYSLTLTGGSITISNNISFLTPEALGVVNQPLAHITGTRSVSGSFTCYLDELTNGSIDLYQDLLNATTTITNNHEINFFVGGRKDSSSPVAPGIMIDLPQCHLEIPSINIDDVIGFEVNFTALPTSLSGTDEIAKIRYVGK